MPIKAYYHGHGQAVMADMEKRYPGRAKEMFYRTANARGMKPKSKLPKGGTIKGAWGDVGKMREKESRAVGGFKKGKAMTWPS